MNHGPLGQGGQDLVGGLHAHIGPRFHGRHGQIFMKFQMGPVGLVHQKDFPRARQISLILTKSAVTPL
jgi:hypothetical protein